MADDMDQAPSPSPTRLKADRRAGRPTTEETTRLNEEILKAAFAVFLREGFGGASIEQIAQESGTTRRTVLSRFGSKENLLVAVVEMRVWLFSQLIAPTEAQLAMPPMLALKETCRTILNAVVTEDSVKLYLIGTGNVANFPAITEVSLRENDRWAANLAAMVARAQRTGAFAGHDPAMVATGMIGAFISNPINRTVLGDPQFRDPVALNRYFEGLWSFLVGGNDAAR